MVVTCTGGERGSVLNPRLDTPEVVANLAEVRRLEMQRAREILGVQYDLDRVTVVHRSHLWR